MSAMAGPSAAAFLIKRKNKRPAASRSSTATSAPAGSAAASRTVSPRVVQPPLPKVEPDAAAPQPDSASISEIKLFSVSAKTLEKTRFNLMKLNHARDFDPASIPRPILMNRKQPGPRAPPTFAFDEEGNIVGKLKYDDDGKPVLGPDGLQVVERKEQADLSLIGGSEAKKVRKKAIKEVYHQDKDVMRLRREEGTPWVLESGAKRGDNEMEVEGQTGGKAPEHWVGRYVDPHSLPTVLFVSDGVADGFQVIPVGRTYKFEPDRPFKVLDPDAAHKLYEHQSKYKVHDRWAQREGGRSSAHIALPQNGSVRVKQERAHDMRQEARARALEQRMRSQNGEVERRVKVERFDDDDRREGRGLGRGLEGGVDEELDYDEKEDFQDDDDVNTFHHDREEEEEAKATEARLKKEYRIANANVGDRPQIGDDLDDEEDLFGNKELTRDGRKLRKMMRKRMGSEDLFGDSDEDSDASDDTVPEVKKEAEQDKGKEKEKTNPPGSADRPSRPASRGPGGPNRSERGATSPGQSRNMSPTPTKGKSSTAPPQSGASVVARRATSRGASPAIRSRHASPRSASPDAGPSGTHSPRAGSPVTGRAQSPVHQAAGREGSPSGSANPVIRLKNASASSSASASGSPAPSPNGKRKPSPAPSGDIPRKKKKGSNTPTPAPEDFVPPEGMFTKDEVLAWFRKLPSDRVTMQEIVGTFSPKLRMFAHDKGLQDRCSKLFMAWISQVTVKAGPNLVQFKEEYK